MRNVNLILQKQPTILSDEYRIFFTKYNDPPYVKLEKLEIIVQLACDNNIDQILSELKEYVAFNQDILMKLMYRLLENLLVRLEGAP